jgi:hypothetical protein
LQLVQSFLKFPFRFDVARLRAEIDAMPQHFWREHVEGFPGNSALTLITTGGIDNDDIEPPMMPTEALRASPYLQQVLATFRTVHGRARLMRLAPQSGVPPHIDKKYYWRTRTRVHIPITTHPEIKFHCGGEVVHMQAGEAWTFDNWRTHQVVNETPTWRVHLTFDTFGGATFWNMARPWREVQGELPLVQYDPNAQPNLSYETYVEPPVMSPGEVDFELTRLANDVRANPSNDPAAVQRLIGLTGILRREWRQLWAAKGPGEENLPLFEALIMQMMDQCQQHVPNTLRMASNNIAVMQVITADLTAMLKTPKVQMMGGPQLANVAIPIPAYDRPVFIVAAPRSGSTLLFETLAANKGFWNIGGEGHEHVEGIPELQPRNRDYHSNRLTAADAQADIVSQLRAAYAGTLRMADGTTTYAGLGVSRPRAIRLLEKTPKNALRIPFFKAAFPDAKFIYLYRDAQPNISAIMEAWRSGGFKTYAQLPDWQGLPWSLLLIPGWRELIGADLAKIATRQWRDTNETILADLAALPQNDWTAIRYEDFIANPDSELKRLCAFADVPFDPAMPGAGGTSLRNSRYTLTAPDANKWRKNEAAMAPYAAETSATTAKLAALPK